MKSLFLAALLTAPQTKSTDSPDPLAYFPMEVGHRWVYQSGGSDVVFQVQGKTRLDGGECFIVHRTIGKQVHPFYVSVSATGVRIHQDGNDVFDPPFPEVVFPLREAHEWKWRGKVGTQERSAECRCAGLQPVRVPLGKFRAYVIEESVTLQSRETGRTTLWLAEGIGVVKLEGKRDNLRDPSGEVFTWELKEFARVVKE